MVRRIVQDLRSSAARLRRDESGAMLVIMALMMTMLLSLLSVGIEVGSWYMTRRALQTAADAAAIAGALEGARGTPGRTVSAAKTEAVRNGAKETADAILVHTPPTSGTFKGDPQAVEAIVTRQQPRLFSAVLAGGTMEISARAVARVNLTGQACVLALDPTASGALTGQGSTIVTMQGCLLAANSRSNSAVQLSGSSMVSADGLWTAGDVSLGGSSSYAFVNPPVTHAWPLPDPYANLTIPPLGPCRSTNTKINKPLTEPLQPGTYCGEFSIGSQGVVVLNPGTYYIDRGDLTINAQAQVRCNCTVPGDGVTFVLTSSGSASDIGSVDINGGANIQLRAPSGAGYPFPGILFYQDRRAPSGRVNTFNGGSDIVMSGAFYFPSQAIKWNGNTAVGGSTACVQIIARTVAFGGNSTLDSSGCAALRARPVNTTAAALGE